VVRHLDGTVQQRGDERGPRRITDDQGPGGKPGAGDAGDGEKVLGHEETPEKGTVRL
jgi:hypothetical protein